MLINFFFLFLCFWIVLVNFWFCVNIFREVVKYFLLNFWFCLVFENVFCIDFFSFLCRVFKCDFVLVMMLFIDCSIVFLLLVSCVSFLFVFFRVFIVYCVVLEIVFIKLFILIILFLFFVILFKDLMLL